jgi:hypothetical protein
MAYERRPMGPIGGAGLVAVGLGMLAWCLWESASLARALGAPTVDAKVVSTSKGHKGQWTTTVSMGRKTCKLDSFHAEPGEQVVVLVDPAYPERCLPNAFFPSGYRPLSTFVFGGLALGAGVSGLRAWQRRRG